MSSAAQVTQDPDFLKLGNDDRRYVLSQVDPDFAKLSSDDQSHVVSQLGTHPSSAPAAPATTSAADATAPIKSYSLGDLATPDLGATAPSLSADLERPLTAVRGAFGLPQLSSESQQRVNAENLRAADARIKNASIGPRPNDFATAADNTAADIRYGTTVTPVGSLLHAMGAEGTANGEPEGVADFFGGPIEGPFRVEAGLARAMEEPGNRLAGGNEAVRGAMQTLMPVAAATQPEFLATLPAYAGAGEAAQYGLEKAGVDPQTAEMVANAALLSASGIHGAEQEGAFGSTLSRDMAASEPVVEGTPCPTISAMCGSASPIRWRRPSSRR